MFLWPSQACSARVSWVNRHLAVPHRALGRKSLLALLYPLQDRFYTEREQSRAASTELQTSALADLASLRSRLWDLLANDYAATYLDASFVDAISARR